MIVCGINVEIIPVTLLRVSDFYYPVVQDTGEVVIDDGMNYVIKRPQINRQTGGTYVVNIHGRVDYQIGATVAREVKA